jgi:DNA-directed RNA polymerase subunit RPC12/RpoP
VTGVITVCRTCGRDFEPEPAAIRAGRWRECPACTTKPPSEPEMRCPDCGRVLKGTKRTICLGCLVGGSPL